MNVEEQVRAALQRAGEERHVDVSTLHAATKQALYTRTGKAAPGRRWRPMVLGAAAAAAAIVGVVALPSVNLPGLPDLGPRPAGHSQGEVDDEFSCPLVGKTHFEGENDDDSFLPELTEELRPAGEAAGAPRWETQRTTTGATLRLGNADGTLASVTTFEDSSHGPRPVLTEKCINTPAASSALVQAGLPVEGPGAFSEDNLAPGSLRVVDRLTYDVRGLERRWTIWAEPCGRSVCLKAGATDSFVSGRLSPDALLPEDATFFLANPDDMVGQDLGLRLVFVYDREDRLKSVGWDSPGGNGHSAKALRGGWRGQLFVLLASDTDLTRVWVTFVDGSGRSYGRDDFLE